jgi:hypothetical protein
MRLNKKTHFSLMLLMGLIAASMPSCRYPALITPTAKNIPQEAGTSVPPSTPLTNYSYDSVLSPDGNHYAEIRDGNRLVVLDITGKETEISNAEEIIQLSWFPDSQHIIYNDRITSEAGYPSHEYRVWIANIASKETYQVDDGFAPLISPDGRLVALLHGGRTGDACVVGFKLCILELDQGFHPISFTWQDQISGIPLSEIDESFYPHLESHYEFPGKWVNESLLVVAMKWGCKVDDPQNGIYEINLDSNEARKVEDLPTE